MGGLARQHGLEPRREPEPARRTPAAAPLRVPAARDPFAPAAAGNGRTARDLASSPYRIAVPAAGNGMRVLYMPPETITARVPDDLDADPAVEAQPAAAFEEAGDSSVIELDDVGRGPGAAAPLNGTEAAEDEGASASTQPQTAIGATRAGARATDASPDVRAEASKEAPAPGAEELEDESARQAGEADAEAATEESEVIELDAETVPQPAETLARGGGDSTEADGDAPDPQVIVRRWQGGVSAASTGLAHRNMSAVVGGPARIASAADKANAARRAKTQEVPADAAANITPPPKVPDPPPPPRSDPIPTQTAAIEAASKKRLPAVQLPGLVASSPHEVVPGMWVGGNMPRLGDHAVSNKLFQLLVTEGAEKVAQIPDAKEDPERKALEDARRVLAAPIQKEKKEGEGEPAPLVDKGPEGVEPLPPGVGTPVAKVVARLLASLATGTADVLLRLRRMAYPKGGLVKLFPDIGRPLADKVGPRMNTELHEIAAAAGVGGAELDGMVEERRKELEKDAADTQQAIVKCHDQATEAVSQGGQEALDAIEGARQLTDEEIIKRQEAASGGSDPEVIHARRDLVIRWVRGRVTTETSYYQKAGEKREKELDQAQLERSEAYTSLAQREEYQGLYPAPPQPAHDRSKPEIVRRLADFAAAVRADARSAVEALKKAMRPMFATARDNTRDNRAAVEKAGNEAIDAARSWAEDRVLEGKSWWERFKAKLSRWFGDSQKANEQWSVQRTEETRNGIASDLGSVAAIQQAVANGATQEKLLQSGKLTAEQRAVVTEFFAQPPGAHPLDIAAAALRQRLANQYLEVARPAFEAELLAKPDGELPKVAELANLARPTFKGSKIAQDIHAQLDNFDSDESAMLRSLEGLSAFEGALVRRLYRAMFHVDMDFAMQAAFDSDEMDQAKLRLEGKGADADAAALDDAFGIINTDEKAIMDLLRGRSQEEIEQIRAAYKRRYGKDLDRALIDNLDEGNEQDQAGALMRGDKEAADSIAIDDAMRGGLTGWGTQEEDIEATYKRVHDEVLALAQREGWSSEQMKAEIRRRTGRIEKDFNERYKNVEQYNEPGLEGTSVLRRAFSSEMDPGPERDLANALADDDMVKADAARIEIERQGVWASDEAINKVLTNQYERALQDTRLDQGPARKMRTDRLRDEILKHNPKISEEELSRRIMAFERDMDREMGEEAQRRSRISMEALNDAYQKKYFYPLSYTIEANMSGVDLEKARALHKQGGRLTALQEVDYATKGVGTDEDALRNRLGSMTKSEIETLKAAWEAEHPGESFEAMLRGELSGRDESDIMDMVEHGAPESAKERIAQEQRRVNRELGELTGALGGAAAGNEADWVTQQMSRLDELKADFDRRDLSGEERELLRDQLDYRVEIVQEGVEDHRRAIDSVANFAAQVASLAVAVAVGAALSFLSGGALGPVMIAMIASVAATVTTMGTKALVQGGSYGAEDIGVDLAIGVVDALTAAATAGMGGKILRGATGAAEQAAQRAVQPNRFMRFLGKVGGAEVMQGVAKSRAGQVAGKVASGLNQMESGFLARGMKGTNILARMAEGDSKALRILAEGLAEGIENAVSALPSSFTGTALNDKTWEGNPLLNLAGGTYEGVKGAVQMGAVMHGARGAYGALGSHIRLSTPEGRLTEANRILNDAREQHRAKNPNATHQDFLGSSEAHRAQAEIEQRGLIGEQRQLAKPDERKAPSDTPQVEPRKEPAVQPEEAPRPEARPEPAQRVAAEAGAGDGAAPVHPDPAVDPATQALREALPRAMTERVDVRVNEKLEGNSVHVIPDPRGPGHGVRVEVGPHATPTDVLLHAHTIQSMRRYQGLLGKLRQARDWFNLTTVGSAGWEAKLELEKLPGIIHERMQRLSEGGLSPEAQIRLVDEVNHLGRQIDAYQHVLDTPALREAPGRGFVAAKGEAVPGVRTDAPLRTLEGMKASKLALVEDSPLNDQHHAVYQIGHEWQEKGRIYRRVVVHDAAGRIERVREEIQLLDPHTEHPNGIWVQRGSEASGLQGMGVVGERASQITVEEGRFGAMADERGQTGTAMQKARQEQAAGTRRVALDEGLLRNASNNGFDGAFLRINADGSATMVVVEAKNQPSGLSLESFTAVKGEQFKKNLDNLRRLLKSNAPEQLGISAQDHALMLKAVNARSPNVEIQVHTTPETPLGHRDHPSSTILQKLEESVNERGINAGFVKVVHVPLEESVTRRATKEVQKRDAIGETSVRLKQLAGEGAKENSLAHRHAQSMLLAEGAFSKGLVKPHAGGEGKFVDEAGTLFEVLTPRAGVTTARTLAAEVVRRLHAPAPVGAKGQRMVILDLSSLSAAMQRDVLKLLEQNPRAMRRAQNILIHDRANNEMKPFDPKEGS
ncbi:Annexin [Variovorax sp. PBS-H4]|uniref:hypothetical protein n=1 Tax=Variovorax sp. PBS-H4 TaxID=434008 RepID=UPI0013183A84|nr:hypothetical protein [Variovorax sp. PBS-H4]VTU19999.1 Annexin [Variovorax sp. PBS-H4]